MIKNVSHASVSRLVGDSLMCFDTALDKAAENCFCIGDPSFGDEEPLL
jgi:hypothetical protein